MQSCTCQRLAAAQLGRLHACGANGTLGIRHGCRFVFSRPQVVIPPVSAAASMWHRDLGRRAAGSAASSQSCLSRGGCGIARQCDAGTTVRPATATPGLRCLASIAEPAVAADEGASAEGATQRPAAARRYGAVALGFVDLLSACFRWTIKDVMEGCKRSMMWIGLLCAGNGCCPACSRRARYTLATTLARSTTGSGSRIHTARLRCTCCCDVDAAKT